MADTDDKIKELKAALQKVSDFLDKEEVKTALKQIPSSIKDPVFKGLKQVLEVVKKALDELKKNLGAVTTVQDLLKVINDLLEAAEGLAPGEKDTLEAIKKTVQTLQQIPKAEEIAAIINLIEQIITKLGNL